jgi:hypothetical protein
MDTVPPVKESEPIRLRALDAEDLTTVAAFLQDAIANVSEMAYLPDERRFALAVCRFRWEEALKSEPENAFRRISCVVTVESVDQPKYRGFSLKDRGRLMPLLTVTYEDGAVLLTFGGDAAIKLKVDSLDLRIEDYGICWPTARMPEHEGSLP